MTTPQPHDPTTPTPDRAPRPPRGRRRTALIAGGAVAMLAVGVAAGYILGQRPDADAPASEVNRADPTATAAAFVTRYARHDPSACELASTELRAQLTRDGRCAGAPAGPAPKVDVLIPASPCGTRAGMDAAVAPAGEVGAPYAHIGLAVSGSTWEVRSVLPLSDRGVIKPYGCAPPSTHYGDSS
jgi:hypothetical protein